MSEWKIVPLTDLYEIGSGLSKPRSEFGFGHGFLTFKDVLDNFFVPDQLSALVNSSEKEQANCSVMRGDVFLTRTSETQPELGMSSVALKDYPKATFNGFTKRLRPKTPDAIVPEYAAYYFRGPRFRQSVTSMSSLSTRASLNNEMISRLSIVLPPVSEQKAIGIILKALDDKIELNRRRNRTLEAMARAIFQSWFVDFDPVKAKAAGQAPAGLSPEIAALFPDRFEDSPLGPIPAGWRVSTVGEYCAKITDGSHYSPSSVEDGLPMASVKDMTDWGITVNTCRRISKSDFEALVANDCQPQQGDVLLAKDGATCLETAFEYRQRDRIVLLSSVAMLRPRQLSDAAYLHLWVTSPATKHYLREGFVSGSAIPRVVLKDLRRAQLLHPSNSMLAEFSNKVEPIRAAVRANVVISETLAALRDAMLPKLISGELRVPDAERIVGRAV